MKKTIILLTLVVLTAFSGNAQEKKWRFNIDGGGFINTGNVDNISFTQGAGAKRNDSIIELDANYKYIIAQQDGILNNRELFSSVQLDLWQYNRWSPFIAANDLINRFKGYDNKLSLLAGAKYRIYTKPAVADYSISGAFVYDFVDYYGQTDLDDQKARMSLRFKMKQKIGKITDIKHTTFYQPAFDDFDGDYIVSSSTKIDNHIWKNLSLGLGFTYEYRSLVPDGTKKQDVHFDVGLSFVF